MSLSDSYVHDMGATTSEIEYLHEQKIDCWCGPVVDGDVIYHGDLGADPNFDPFGPPTAG